MSTSAQPHMGRRVSSTILLAMNAASPAAWAPLAFNKLVTGALDTTLSCFNKLGRFDPTNPFIAGKGRKLVPG